MNICDKVCSILVDANTEKEAYLKGCKKTAKYIASKKYQKFSMTVKRVPNSTNTFLFTLYTNLDLNEEMKHYCKMCKEYHCSFFVNEEYNCNRCNLKSFMERAKEKTKVSKNYYKEMMNKN